MLTDHDAIAALIYTYAERLDAGDLEGVASLFARATLRNDGFDGAFRGAEDILRLYRNSAVLYDGKPCTKHVTTNLIIEVDESGKTATARSYYSVLQARPELPLQIIIAGRYHDRFAHIDGAWGFTDRLIFIDLKGDLRHHLKFNLS
jgi:3-phenylpropionate/cinnamic acid dioxygenase small subunit